MGIYDVGAPERENREQEETDVAASIAPGRPWARFLTGLARAATSNMLTRGHGWLPGLRGRCRLTEPLSALLWKALGSPMAGLATPRRATAAADVERLTDRLPGSVQSFMVSTEPAQRGCPFKSLADRLRNVSNTCPTAA